jgi:hypothetical protein
MRRREFVLGAASTLTAAPDGALEIRVGGKVATSLYWGEAWDKPFLYPIRTVSGKVLSRGWPIDPREGDSKDHAWHRGFWYGHGDINGSDFWRELGREKTARLVAKAAPRVERSGVAVDLAMTTVAGAQIGSVRQEFRLFDKSDVRIMDARITVYADAGQSLTFGDTDDGGFAFRLSEAFREDKGARLRNSDGLTGTKSIWGKPAKWVDYSTEVQGGRAGVAVLDHPSNLRYPTRWHARGYGLNAANPFALRSFTENPAADSRYTVPAGQTLVLRYRSLIYEGSPDIDRYASEFAKA